MTAVTTALGGPLLLICCRRAESSAMFVWAVAMMVASLGLVGAAANVHRDLILESFSTATLLTASGLFWRATRCFRGASGGLLWLIAGPAIWLITMPIRTESPAWAALSCGIGGIYTCVGVRELYLTRVEKLPSWTIGMVLMVSHAIVFLGRAGLAAAEAAFPEGVTTPFWVVPSLITESMVHINGMALVLMALLLERHERQARQTLMRAVYVDGLTGIANRRRFEEQLVKLASDRRLASTTIGLVLLDLDHFKFVNDSAGHDEGDRVLQKIARVIAGQVRSSHDLAARYGGEEFAILLTGAGMDEAVRVGERVRAAVVEAAIPNLGTGGIVTVSGGVGIVPAGWLHRLRDVLFNQADRALYEAKRRGRNQIVASSELEGAGLLYYPLSGAA